MLEKCLYSRKTTPVYAYASVRIVADLPAGRQVARSEHSPEGQASED